MRDDCREDIGAGKRHEGLIFLFAASGLAVILLVAGSALVARAAAGDRVVRADGGYEANVLPGDAGWTGVSDGFLGDFVSVQDGVMTYDGALRPAPGECGMRPPAWPRIEEAGTIEYRVRCRAVGGDPKHWYQFFLTFYYRTSRYAIRDQLGHYKFDDEHIIHTSYRLPRKSGESAPPTSTGRWETEEWITVRHVVREAGEGKFTLESWVSGPAGTRRHVDALGDQAGYANLFGLSVNANMATSARFDLDYLRWSARAVPFGTPLEPAGTTPEIASIEPRSAGPSGGTSVMIKGGNFHDGTTVRFGAAAADIKIVDAHTISCVVPESVETGWVDVQVENGGGTTTKADAFFFGTLPTLSNAEPVRGTNRGGERVTIRGSGFQSGARIVFGVADATDVRVLSPDEITCTSPPALGGWHGPIKLTVISPDGGQTTQSSLYTYERSSKVKAKSLGWHVDLVDFNFPLAIQKLEEMPFHGMLLRSYNGIRVGAGKFTEQDLQLNLSILEAMKYRRFTDNFLQVNFTGPSEMPSRRFWEDWTEVLASYRRYAQLAREGGFKGIWLDVEAYSGDAGPRLSSHGYLKEGRTLPDVRHQVKLRGKQLMKEVLGAYPDITVITSHGLGFSNPGYDLLPTFYDGMLEAIASDEAFARARLIDGHEPGYYIATPAAFRHAYDQIRKPGGAAYRRIQHPDLWARFGGAAFGNYPEIHDLETFKQHHQSAMNQTDEYVWFFTNGSFFYAWAPPSLAPGSTYAADTDRYIDAMCKMHELPRATPPGRTTPLIDLNMDEQSGRMVKNQAIDLFHGKLSSDQLWTGNTPVLAKRKQNPAALDFRGKREAVVLKKTGRSSRTGLTGRMQTSHLGNLYFTDHTVEFSFWWDGTVSRSDQYLYGVDGGKHRSGEPDTFGYGGRIKAGGRKLVHCQRSNYGGKHGGVEIDLEGARDAGRYRFGQWASVAIRVKGVHTRDWRIYLNGQDVTDTGWAGPLEGHEKVEGFHPPYQEWKNHEMPIDLVLGARHSAEHGITDHFDGMLDAFRISAGQVPAADLLSMP